MQRKEGRKEVKEGGEREVRSEEGKKEGRKEGRKVGRLQVLCMICTLSSSLPKKRWTSLRRKM
jgi:hypothetical protein